MALNLDFGGGSNEYASAASQAVAGANKGGPSFIASILDLVGIGKQVAKGPKDLSDSQTPEGKAGQQADKVAEANRVSEEPVTVSALAEAETALGVQPLPMTASTKPLSPWGQSYLKSIEPLTRIDPDMDILQSSFDRAFGVK